MFFRLCGWVASSITQVSLYLLLGAALLGQELSAQRARPPKWDNVPTGVFYEDAFADGLRGERPESLHGAAGQSSVPAAEATNLLLGKVAKPEAWPSLISAATLEDELKAIKLHGDQALRNEGYFKGRGYRELRPHLGTAAVLFAIIDQFGRPVRWQTDAALARDRFARFAQNAKAGSSQVFREATLRQQELAELIRGAHLAGAALETPPNWPEIADRKLIMQRLEWGMQQTISPAVASDGEYQRSRGQLLHESELTAALAHVLTQPDMPDAEDVEYDELCEQLKRAALELRKSLEQENSEAARRAHGEMKHTCVACHELYRT